MGLKITWTDRRDGRISYGNRTWKALVGNYETTTHVIKCGVVTFKFGVNIRGTVRGGESMERKFLEVWWKEASCCKVLVIGLTPIRF